MTEEARKSTPAQLKDENPFTDEFAEFARETLKEWKVPGVSIAVIDGEEVFAEVCTCSGFILNPNP